MGYFRLNYRACLAFAIKAPAVTTSLDADYNQMYGPVIIHTGAWDE